MELKLSHGDYVPDGAGGFARAGGTEETLERIRLCLCARRGSFPFVPSFGSGLHRLSQEKPSGRLGAACRYVAEALADENVQVERVDLRAQGDAAVLDVTLRLGDETAAITMVTGGQ